MKIILTHEESEKFFYNSICNSLRELYNYGLELDYDENHYFAARKKLQEQKLSTCFEDVLIQILKDGNSLTLIDNELNGEYTKSITLADVHEKVQNTPISHLMDAINETDDATTGDVIIQQVFYNEIIFG